MDKTCSSLAHIGPMAEEVHAAFRLGRDDRHLSPGDSAGLALAGVQGVEAELRRLRELNQDLARRLARLERQLATALAAREEETAAPDLGDRPPSSPF